MFKYIKTKLTPGARALNIAPMFSVPLKEYATTGERDAILASSGMGKSYLTGVIMEETLENKQILCVIDPEGEHFTLAERYPMMIIGGEQANLPLDESAIPLYVDAMLAGGISAVFDLSEFLDEEQQHYYGLIADALFQAEQKYRRKCRIVVEEAQIFAPQRTAAGSVRKKKKTMDPVQASQKLAKRGRKRAIDSLWATQRPASISKDIISQCNRFWFGGITSEIDYKAIKPFLNEAGISFTDIKNLNPGEFYFYSKGVTKKIKSRKRHCKHAGATPEAGMQFSAVTNSSLSSALSELAEQVAHAAAERRKEEAEVSILKRAIRELEKENKKLVKELEQERLATKVIDRLGSAPPVSKSKSLKSRKKVADILDTMEEDLQKTRPEKIYLD